MSDTVSRLDDRALEGTQHRASVTTESAWARAFLIVVAILPQLLSRSLNVPYITAQFFGGTGLLIIVGVMLDTMRQIETHLIQRHYDGFLRKGRIRGRFDNAAREGEPARQTTLVWLCVGVALLLIGGLALLLNH